MVSIHVHVQNELMLHLPALPIDISMVVESLCLLLGGKAQVDHPINPQQEDVDVGGVELICQELEGQGAGDGVTKICGVQLLILAHHLVLRWVIAGAAGIIEVLALGAVCATGIWSGSGLTTRF